MRHLYKEDAGLYLFEKTFIWKQGILYKTKTCAGCMPKSIGSHSFFQILGHPIYKSTHMDSNAPVIEQAS
jgi:hypothetical protein